MTKTMYRSFKNQKPDYGRNHSVKFERRLSERIGQHSRVKERSIKKLSKDLDDHLKEDSPQKQHRVYRSIDYSNSVDKFKLAKENPPIDYMGYIDSKKDRYQEKVENEQIKIRHFPMKITKVKLCINESVKNNNSFGSLMSRKRLANKKIKEEREYRTNVNRLVYQTNKEFHSSAFAAKIENLLNAKWTEKTDSFIVQSELTPQNDDRVHKIMMSKYGRFAS